MRPLSANFGQHCPNLWNLSKLTSDPAKLGQIRCNFSNWPGLASPANHSPSRRRARARPEENGLRDASRSTLRCLATSVNTRGPTACQSHKLWPRSPGPVPTSLQRRMPNSARRWYPSRACAQASFPTGSRPARHTMSPLRCRTHPLPADRDAREGVVTGADDGADGAMAQLPDGQGGVAFHLVPEEQQAAHTEAGLQRVAGQVGHLRRASRGQPVGASGGSALGILYDVVAPCTRPNVRSFKHPLEHGRSQPNLAQESGLRCWRWN